MNARLREGSESPLFAAAASYALGALVLGVLLAFGVLGRPNLGGAMRVAWWAWAAGLIGAAQVTINLMAIPRLGAAPLTAISLSAQLIAAVALDHFGALGLERSPINGWRVGGMVMLLAGVIMMQKR